MNVRRGTRWLVTAGLLALSAIVPGPRPSGQAVAEPFPAQWRLADDRLDQIRGGFVLPNGMDLAIGIDIQTLVNGALALRTEFRTGNGGVPLLFTGAGAPSAVPADEGGHVTAVRGLGMIRLVDGSPTPNASGVGQQRIELSPNGPAAAIPLGSVLLAKDEAGSIVVLQGEGLEVRHMIGSVVGSLVANTADNRSIETIVTVNVDLHNSAVPIGNGMLRWEGIAIEAANRIIR
ncbi:MAG: hypothetical protein EON93_09575 [Burkholderiales bacterium]|nr:MAG: hypothetical protein EON93_09575 [Burkholderiales bacterium]